MVKEKTMEKDAFPLPRSCGLAFKAPDGWHMCHLPVGHKEPHESMRWVWEEGEPLYDEANKDAKPIRFRDQ